MRFLRRGGSGDELPVERESTPDDAPVEAEVGAEDLIGADAYDAPAWLRRKAAAPDQTEADAAQEPEAEAGGEADAEPGAEPEAVAEAEADAEPEAGIEQGAEAEAARAPDNEADAEPEGEAVAGVEANAEPEAEAGAEAEPEAPPETNTAVPAAAASDAESEPERADAPADELEAEGAHDVDAGELEDAEGLSGLVAGGARRSPSSEPPFVDHGPDPISEGHSANLRLAALHLRTGQHALARAQLETLAGRGRLDDEALLDLAEVRWRTGDLGGAGDAANALLARGSEPTLALVIAAEAVAAAGRPTEARRLSSRALEVAEGPLDPFFAGMPRAMIWPAASAGEPAADQPRRRRRPRGEGDGAPSTASEAFAGGRAALARGDANRAGLLLGVAMRLEPGFAEDALRAVAGREDQPLLALVRGDALRLLGREAEALEAFDRARGRSSVGAPPGDEQPGLFDDDQG
jgi:hypothetical protein